MKKVLILGMTSIVGGVETFIMNLYKHIDKTKFQIDFLVLGKLEGQYREELSKDKNVKIFEVEHMKKHPIKAIKKIFKIYKDNKYDIIHMNINSSTPVLYTLPSKLYNKNVKIIAHSHNTNNKISLKHIIFRPLLNLYTDEFLACSNLAGQYMYGKKIANSKKLKILNNGITVDKYIYNEEVRNKLRKKFNIDEKTLVIGHVGRFSEQKNHKFIINFFNDIIYRKKLTCKLLLVGTGENEDNIKNIVKENNLEKYVLFLGLQKDTNELYQMFDLFILPSLYEGLPIVGIEAQASGLKCFFSDKITTEVDITNNCKFFPLKKEIWVENIENFKIYNRLNMESKIKSAKYDIATIIKEIENIYEI